MTVDTDTVLGTIELTEAGKLAGSSPDIQDMVDTMSSSRRASPQEAFEGLTFWSNGYVKVVPVED
ncbi:hypothetical protein ACFQVD_39980 [Streptosporangium amethystogenes subsp. fukuiense]|uniref:CBS domain-containing protein n=1 Tax=Streptosporangium amethystogenes subsp. fukuiense TaxID=698418 RepID=A0ABW2TDY2_9ACTN